MQSDLTYCGRNYNAFKIQVVLGYIHLIEVILIIENYY